MIGTSRSAPIDVAIVEDEKTIREGLGVLIDGAAGFRWSGSFASMEDALPAVAAEPPDVVLVDLGLPGMSGAEGIRRMAERHPGLPLLVLAVYDDDERILDAVLAGAHGYVLKKTPPEVLLSCLRSVADGEAPMSPGLARWVLELPRRGAGVPDLASGEIRILETLAEGHVYGTAAAKLGLSAREIGLRIKRVYDRVHLLAGANVVPSDPR